MKIFASKFFSASSILSTAMCLSAQASEPLYLIYMNPFEVQKYEEEAIKSGYVRPEIPSIIKPEEHLDYVLKNSDKFNYSPGIDRVKSEIIRETNLRKVDGTFLQIPAFFAYLNDNELALLSKSNRVVSAQKMNMGDKSFTFSSYYDYSAGGETVPWGKQAIGADDSISVSNNFYIVDTRHDSLALSGEFNMSYTNNSGYYFPDHAASVLSLAIGRNNSSRIRGINPGQPVVHLGTQLNEADLIYNVSTASSMAEWSNQFSTLNLSVNQGDESNSNIFNHNRGLGNALRRASGRLFIAQSAGNFNRNACFSAFNYSSIAGNSDSYDGIMVVGGTDRFGDRYTVTPNPYPYATEDRSNFGPCIEVWAPGQSMTTTLSDGTLVTATGTSFAAPLVAAVAGRYGNTSTRPIEREAYIRNGSSFTGKFEGAPTSNLPIYQVRYAAPLPIPSRLPISAVYSQTNTTNLSKLVDEKFYDGINWSAGSGWGSIVIDLGSARNVKGLRVMMRSSANGGALNFAVHGGNAINITGPASAVIANNPIAYKNTNDQFDLVPYYIPLNGNYRYLMLEANNTASWLSYSEIEVYGN